MAQTILQLAQDVCDRETVKAPRTLFNTNDKIARILRMAAQDTVRDMMRSAHRNGLSGFKAQWVFAVRPQIYSYQLPPDYYRMIDGTEQRDRWPLGILGPVAPQTWSNWIAGLGFTAVPMGWRIDNNMIHIEPVPQQEEAIVIEYMSKYAVVRDAVDTDLEPVNGYLQPKLPLVPREGYTAPDGLPAVDPGAAPEWGTATWGTSIWGETGEYQMRRVPASTADAEVTRFPQYQVRAERFTSDLDKSAFEDDHVLSLGMTWRLLKAMRRPYGEAKDEFEREKNVFLADDASKGRSIVFGDVTVHNEIEPLGDGRWILS